MNIPIQNIKAKNNLHDQWFDLIGTKNSSIHIRMNWFYLSTSLHYYQQMKQLNREHMNLMSSKIPKLLSTSLLIVHIERAEQLPLTHHGKTLEPYPFCTIKIDSYQEKTSIIKSSTNPCWMKSFMFMLHNPEKSLLQININDSSNKNLIIGTVEISIKRLMEENDLIIHRSYPLKSSLTASTRTKLYLKLQLQIMTKLTSIKSQTTNDIQFYNSIKNNVQRKKIQY